MFTLKVEKMSCGGCAARVTRAVQAVDPRATVDVLLQERRVRVESAVSPATVANAISAAGFPASQLVA